MLDFLTVVGMAPSDPKEKPRKWKHSGDLWPSNFPEGTERARCWCGDLCVSKRCDDWDDKHGRRFWMCPNYAHDKVKPKNVYDYPKVRVSNCHENTSNDCQL